jgi:hypothetical protein
MFKRALVDNGGPEGAVRVENDAKFSHRAMDFGGKSCLWKTATDRYDPKSATKPLSGP